jgi:hypothetical protein
MAVYSIMGALFVVGWLVALGLEYKARYDLKLLKDPVVDEYAVILAAPSGDTPRPSTTTTAVATEPFDVYSNFKAPPKPVS